MGMLLHHHRGEKKNLPPMEKKAVENKPIIEETREVKKNDTARKGRNSTSIIK